MIAGRLRLLRGARSPAGRPPPHDLDAEAAVLSAVMLKCEALDVVAPILKPKSFYNPANGAIFEAALDIAGRGAPVDVVTIATWLKDRERLVRAGGTSYLAQLIDATPAISNVEEHARTVLRKARMRTVIAAAHEIAAEGYGDVGDEEDWISSAEQRLASIVEDESAADTVPFVDAVRGVFQGLMNELEHPERVEGVPTGLRDLDALLGPLKPGKVTTIGGYWGDGKSALGLQVALAATQAKRPVPTAGLIVSAEMLADEIATRGLFMAARIDSSKARPDKLRWLTPLDWRGLQDAGSQLARIHLSIDDRADISAADIRASVRRRRAIEARAGNELRIVVVDYIQLIEARSALGRDANREQEVAHVARSLKKLAKESKVHVVALAQLNDDAHRRSKDDERKPTSHEFRESKAIPMNADNVILIHNPSARARAQAYRDGGKVSVPGSEIVELIVDKHRGGPTGTVRVVFHPSRTLFSDFDGEL